jgi:hypothetical protein
MVRITREKVAGHYRAWISVVARVPAPPVRTTGPAVAVHLGWRSLPDGALRVAAVGGIVAPPQQLADVARPRGAGCEIVVPASWRRLADRINTVRSRRATDLEQLRGWLVDWVATHPDATWELAAVEDLRRWRSGDFAALAVRLRDNPPSQLAEPAERLKAWRRHDRHLWEWEANERRQLLARRDDAWRRVAAWLTGRAARILTDSWPLTGLSAVPDVAEPDDHQARAARANLVLAAPGTLRAAIENAAQARGVPVVARELTAAASHHACGQPFSASARMASVLVRCQQCGQEVDQDYNTLLHLLAADAGSDPSARLPASRQRRGLVPATPSSPRGSPARGDGA